jgi:hypothetical protein
MFIWTTTASLREIPILYAIACYTGVISILKWIHKLLSDRLIGQFNKAYAGATDINREIAIPEYDWQKGDPETFYKTFVARPHPVVLRGFMKDTTLLKEMGWDEVLKKYGKEDVFLTKKELDGYPGKLEEVDQPKTYLHNSETLFNKYPAIK